MNPRHKIGDLILAGLGIGIITSINKNIGTILDDIEKDPILYDVVWFDHRDRLNIVQGYTESSIDSMRYHFNQVCIETANGDRRK